MELEVLKASPMLYFLYKVLLLQVSITSPNSASNQRPSVQIQDPMLMGDILIQMATIVFKVQIPRKRMKASLDSGHL